MTDKVREALSAIMDGEAAELETRRVLDRVAEDDDLRDRWDRYHLVRSVIAGDTADMRDGAEAIRRLWSGVEAGEGESEDLAAGDIVPHGHAFGLRTGAALLGVAAAAVFSIWLYPVQGYVADPIAADPVAQVSEPAALSGHVAWDALPAEDRARAQAYLLQHLRRHSMANRAHPVPIAKLAAYRPQSQVDPDE